MSNDVAVSVEEVSKRFRLFHEKYTSLKERVIHAGRVPYDDLWALRDVAFEVKEGETLGILGRNGSGKSTLLKCICGILRPTSGQVVVRGSLAGLLELGAGFQPELSGRDNIYLNGSLLGLSRKEIDKRVPEIIDFAEIENFIDNQVKFYSSGMYIRLGFAIAVSADPDILVIDEVLAVGDERFQRKCMDRVKRFQEEGRTIIFVSHAPDMIRSICDQALVMNSGRMVGHGKPGDAVRIFREYLLEAGDALPAAKTQELAALPEATSVDAAAVGRAANDVPGERVAVGKQAIAEAGSRSVRLTKVEVHHAHGAERPYLLAGEPCNIEVGFDAVEPVTGAEFTLEIVDDDSNIVFGTDTAIMGAPCDIVPGPGVLTFAVGSLVLLDGTFDVNVSVRSQRGATLFDLREPACRLEVANPGREVGLVALRVSSSLSQPGGQQGGVQENVIESVPDASEASLSFPI